MSESDLPPDLVDEVERLAKRLRTASTDEEASMYRSAIDHHLIDAEFDWRIRDDADGNTLVLYPAEWVDGVAQLDRIENTDRAVEVPLEATEDHEWEALQASNRTVVETVEARHGAAHATNTEAFATFLENHYLLPIQAATPAHVEVFLTDYYPRNVWPSDVERSRVEESVDIAIAVADELSGSQ